MDDVVATNHLINLAIEAAQKGAGGITRLISSTYFTFQVEGDELVFTEELRAQVEATLGEPLIERVFAGLEGEVALVPASAVTTEYVAGFGWMYVTRKGRYGSFETEAQALAAGRASI